MVPETRNFISNTCTTDKRNCHNLCNLKELCQCGHFRVLFMAELYDRPNKVDRHSAKIQEHATATRGVSSIEFSTRRSKGDVEICNSTILPSLSIPPSATSSLLDGLFHFNHPLTKAIQYRSQTFLKTWAFSWTIASKARQMLFMIGR